MRSSAVLALAFAAAASPAFAAPLASPATRNFARAESTASSSTDVSSEAAIKLGTIANIAGFAAPVIGGIIDHFKNKGNQKQRRDAMEVEALLARGEIDESEAAIKLGTIANIAGFAAPVIGGIIDHFRNKDKPKRDDESAALALNLLGHLRLPMGHGPVVKTREAPADDSEAIKLGTVANIASIGSSVVSAFHNLFGRDSQGEFFDLLARGELSDDDSGAIVLRPGMQPVRIPTGLSGLIHIGRDVADQDSEAVRLNTIATIAGIGSNVVNVWHTLFGGNKKRSDELTELLARSDDPDSEAIRLSTIGKIASIGSSLVNVVHGLFSGNQQKRELIEFLARADTTDESDAIKLGTIANIAGIGSSVVSVFHNLFGGNQKREFEELMVRAADDEAAAVKLSTLGNIASIGGSVISAIHNLFSSNNQNKKREFMELLARASADETGVDSSEAAIKLGTIANIAGFAAPVIGGIIDHFRNKDKPKREDIESLIARELTVRATAEGIDESDAISLKTIGTIASFAAPLVGGIIDHFTNKDKPKREDFEDLFARELIARAAEDESDAISLKTVGTIASFAAPVIGGIIDHFTNKGKRDFEDILFQARSLNDLD